MPNVRFQSNNHSDLNGKRISQQLAASEGLGFAPPTLSGKKNRVLN